MPPSTAEIWSFVHAERGRLADDLAHLTDEQWATPSLCAGWSVHDVLAHLVDTAHTGKLAFVGSMIASAGNFDRANERGVKRHLGATGAHTLEAFRAARTLTKSPPASPSTRLVEAIAHGEDIRRPLGITRDYEAWAIHDAIDYLARTPASFGGCRELAARVRLVTNGGGSSWGEGPEVTASALDLLLTATGREVGEGRLSGPGVALVSEHLAR
ncbi:maleylpyruvate isomerase family mycothiol-dependent enzyme [Leucobacter sp. UCMA 4100]|uniref:maleylpyruvate isomerase family mycothiol-dependent enzyme n=1 Tax=Leucobacter sp. UCMA 4100 TaxID=2810534 RepID=UPI0022EA872B|nr:maleylpyruvate isomerase family mycothiol-dependent enzyme [Leucobacter sp. UCMA 4100]MDA3146865.1 maleylpyruvate isomerase family mycothiol-dependent enzyme [Leucobacter sp. UCMA 4100]